MHRGAHRSWGLRSDSQIHGVRLADPSESFGSCLGRTHISWGFEEASTSIPNEGIEFADILTTGLKIKLQVSALPRPTCDSTMLERSPSFDKSAGGCASWGCTLWARTWLPKGNGSRVKVTKHYSIAEFGQRFVSAYSMNTLNISFTPFSFYLRCEVHTYAEHPGRIKADKTLRFGTDPVYKI